MSSINPPIDSPVKFEGKSPLEIIADFEKLKIETAEINARIKAVESTPLSGEVLSPPPLGEVLNELREMRREIREIKEDVSVMKSELDSQKQIHNQFEENVSSIESESNQNEIQKMPSIERDIREQIYGKWRGVDDHSFYFSTKFEGDTFLIKWHRANSYEEVTLGVEDTLGDGNRSTMTVENNKVVQRDVDNQGEEYFRLEFYIENERLLRVDYFEAKLNSKNTYERIGDPDPE